MTFFVGDYVKIHAPSKVTGVFMSAILFALIREHDKEVAIVADAHAGSPDVASKPVGRISKTDYYLGITRAVSLRSTCLRHRYGAVIVKNDEIIATGYNGATRGEQNCCDAGECYRKRMGIPHGEQYEKCVAVHAEQNAIISAKRSEMIGATLYLYGYDVVDDKEIKAIPCDICSRLIKNAGIERVVSNNE